jgi:hypothetical protein
VDKAPDDWRAQAALGHALLQDGQLREASSALERGLSLSAAQPTTLLLFADACSAAGDSERAEQLLRKAIELAPRSGSAWLRLAHLRRFEDPEAEDVRRLTALVAEAGLAPADAEALHFALGKALDDLGRFGEAFAHFERANRLHRQARPFDLHALAELAERVMTVCDAELLRRAAEVGTDSELPLFVVGVPRSGSTLVEQIVASHPRAYGVGELRTLARLAADLPGRMRTQATFPECLRQLDRAMAGAVAGDYLRRLTRDAPGDVLRVCDKMLSHVLLIGLIALLFPRARVLWVRRDPMAAGLSMYMHAFSGPGVGYAYDLGDIGTYQLLCDRLMRHWQANSSLQIAEIEYEALVREPGAGVRNLLGSAGLAWDERCLEPHRAERQVRTLSEWQVREPIHTRSVERWRRYEAELAPLRERLRAG